MRGIVVSLVVFLIVTGALLYRTSAQGNDTAIATPTTPALVAIPTNTPATSAATPTARRSLSQTQVERLPSTATATTQIETEPTPEPTEAAPVQEIATVVQSDEPADDIIEADFEEADVVEDEVDESDESSDLHLAGAATADDALHSGIWADAIHTIDGGVMAMVLPESANVRSAPTTDAPVVTELLAGWPITLYGAEIGEMASGTDVWYRTWSGSYLSAATVGPFVAPTPDETYSGHWVDVDLTTNYAIAYVDSTPVYAAITITGKPGFETPTGTYTIFRRVESDTLDSSTTGIAAGDAESYLISDVPHVQYFADGGFALHANYWSDPWEYGYDRSHGCVNLMPEDAAWFWNFLSIGSAVSIHY
ncbi:MAG: L,D-transpeptidase family protein [Thermomicrobiales bacterium]|nr:L,D-transpeptidase family protein [Thermomicrobiales bacterium]